MTHVVFRYTLGEQSWTLDWSALDVDDYIALKKATGYGVYELATEHDKLDPLAVKAIVWMARRKAGETLDWDDPKMSFTFFDLRIKKLRDDTVTGDEAGDVKPVPTRAPRAPKPRAPRQTSRNK